MNTELLDRLLAEAAAEKDAAIRLPEPVQRRRIREEAGLSQADLAAVLGVTRVSVTRWESGKRIPVYANAEAYSELLCRLAA